MTAAEEQAALARLDMFAEQLAGTDPGMQAVLRQPDLRGRRHAAIEGVLPVILPSGRIREFAITLRFVGLDVWRLPITYGNVEQLPPDLERHIVTDGQFCLWLPQRAPRDFHEEWGLLAHLDRVREFLHLQCIYEVRKRLGVDPLWPGKEWDHALKAHHQWLREALGGIPDEALSALLPYLTGARRCTPGQRCPCGSGRPAKDCHRRQLIELSQLALGLPPGELWAAIHNTTAPKRVR
jgi:SEC-C motif